MPIVTTDPAQCTERVDRDLIGRARPERSARPLLDFREPTGFVRYPYYTIREVTRILCISDDLVRSLFRNGKHGQVLEICNAKPGRRTYRTLLIPYSTLIVFIRRFSKER
ncbi:MAG: hypothetical protein NTV05_15155 [Acidobacteria bacterium]|nr:hypothetical protein [Acidobacteriota bacterium]